MRIGITEIALIIIIIIALIKPDKLKEYSKTLGETYRTIKKEKEKTETEILKPLQDDINSIKEPLNEIIQPVKNMENLIHGETEQGGK